MKQTFWLDKNIDLDLHLIKIVVSYLDMRTEDEFRDRAEFVNKRKCF